MSDDCVRARTDGRTGHLTLDRPRALNALTRPMVNRIDEVLTRWEHDPAVESVLLSGAGSAASARAATSA